MEIIKLKDNTIVFENSRDLSIFNNANMCKIEKNRGNDKKIEFIKNIQFAKTFDEINRYIYLNDDEINVYLDLFNLFIEKVVVKQRIFLLGKTTINILLYEKLIYNENYVLISEKIEEDNLKYIDGFDLIILSQNTKMSPLYEKINLYCSKNNIKIFNIYIDQEKYVLGPYLKNDGLDSFCHSCFCKRGEINNINCSEIRIKREIAVLNEYDDTQYLHLCTFRLADNVSNIIVEFVSEKRNYDFDGVYIYDETVENSLEFIHIYSIPFCKKCKKSMNFLYHSHKQFEREHTGSVEQDFINSKYGVFRKLISSKTVLNDKRIFYYTIQIPCIFNAINNYVYEVFSYNIAGGVSANRKQALGKAIGEAVERYCLEAYDVNDLTKSSIDSLLNNKKKTMGGLQLFDDWQYEQKDFPFVKINDLMDIYWTTAKDILNDQVIYVPASFVYSRFKKVCENNSIGYLTTSGTAASVDFESAILFGIYELVERDCTIITWLQRLKVPRVLIDIEMIENEELRRSINILRSNEIDFEIYYITLDLKIPCFMVIGYSNNKTLPTKLVGAGCRMNKDEALIRALEEIIQGCGWSSLQKETRQFVLEEDFKNVKGFRDRVSLYAMKEMEKEFDFLKSENVIDYNFINDVKCSLKQEYSECLNILANNNMQLVVKDLTTSDIAQLGFTVVKVIIPELQQIEANYNFRYLNCIRTKEVPRKLGYKDFVEDSKQYNRAPHPFP